MPVPALIVPEDELDVGSVPAFRVALKEACGACDGLIVDLSDVSFIDSTGLSALLQASERFRRDGNVIAVVAPRGSAAAVLLTLSGLRRRLTVFETRGAALDAADV